MKKQLLCWACGGGASWAATAPEPRPRRPAAIKPSRPAVGILNIAPSEGAASRGRDRYPTGPARPWIYSPPEVAGAGRINRVSQVSPLSEPRGSVGSGPWETSPILASSCRATGRGPSGAGTARFARPRIRLHGPRRRSRQRRRGAPTNRLRPWVSRFSCGRRRSAGRSIAQRANWPGGWRSRRMTPKRAWTSQACCCSGDRKSGLEMQAMALAQTQVYRRVFGNGRGLRVLAFLAPGDLAANTPLDYLLEASDVDLTLVYCNGPPPAFEDLPDHDVAILAVNRSEETADLLSQLQGVFDDWPRPVVNGRPERIAALTPNRLSATLAGHRRLACPDTRRLSRRRLLAATRSTSPEPWDGPLFPVVIRPVAAETGRQPEKVDLIGALDACLAQIPDGDVEVAAFYDYSGQDGLFRKFRVAVIDGKPHIDHVAVSPHWRARYCSLASLDWGLGDRTQEARLMATFTETFALRHRVAFDTLVEAVQLDYFDIDCAESIDGRLLVFEAGVAMLTHAADPPHLHAMRAPAASRISAAFVAALTARAARRADAPSDLGAARPVAACGVTASSALAAGPTGRTAPERAGADGSAVSPQE